MHGGLEVLDDQPLTPGAMFFPSFERQKFRNYFQPSRVVIGVFQDIRLNRLNAITLCFNMHCSYKPTMMAFAVWRGSHTYTLLGDAVECVLAVPGERFANETLRCGLDSGRETDKIGALGLRLSSSATVSTPGLADCIANIECRIAHKIETGDHFTVIVEVLRYGVNPQNNQRCLLSVGARHDGYEVLAKHGIHRLAVVRETGKYGAEGIQ